MLEQFIREAKRKGQMTAVYKNKIRENFRIRQDAEEQRLTEEERQKQIELDKMLAMKLQLDEENHRRQQIELEEKERLHAQQTVEEENWQKERENRITVEFERLQNQLLEDLRRQVEFKYQRRFQEIQLNTQRNLIEEAQKSFQPSVRDTGKEGHKVLTQSELLTYWKCDEVSHKKKECTAILFCTNCSKNNHTTSKCRQVFKENCMYCK